LPSLIAGTTTDDELAVRVSKLLLEGIPQAEAVAVVQYAEADADWSRSAAGEPPSPQLMKVDTRDNYTGRFRPSRRMMLKSLHGQQSVMHIWEDEGSSLQFTSSEGLGWAFCSPIRGDACRGWCLYVSGKGSRRGNMFVEESTLQGDLRFTELLAQFIGSVRQVRSLQSQQTRLSTFFSPKVIENLTKAESARMELNPAERDVTVLFCDLRGFSKRSEALQHDLPALLNCVSEALGVMAHGVIERDGAIADFQGDAILGFWGWPIPDANGPWPACRAALAIAEGFYKANAQAGHKLSGLSAGIGVAHGRALAGRIGTEQQAKIGVFGPVVNQGSRLEGMTKQFGVSICIDEGTAKYLREKVPPEEAVTRLLARVRPKGMGTPISVYELLPPNTAKPQYIAAYESAAKAVIAGKWPEVRTYLQKFPADDGAVNFLRSFLEKAPEQPGPDWDGAIQLESK
jgi:adenylate cyclase